MGRPGPVWPWGVGALASGIVMVVAGLVSGRGWDADPEFSAVGTLAGLVAFAAGITALVFVVGGLVAVLRRATARVRRGSVEPG